MDLSVATTFGDLLRRYRLAAGLTQEELAEQAHLSPRAISDLERGRATARGGTRFSCWSRLSS
jgi:transcriptional regulator with XRE-family HTH domain